MRCHRCGELVGKYRFPFRKLCRTCLQAAIKEASKIHDSIDTFAVTYGCSPGMIAEFAPWVLKGIEIDRPPWTEEQEQ